MLLDSEEALVGEIRAFVNSPDQTGNARLAVLAEQYSEACLRANVRLARCQDFLARGLRTQAIHLAEAEPDLVRTVALLTFPEIDAWEEVSASYGWPRCVPLRLEVVNSLTAAYELERLVAPLLPRLRVLALSKASLKERLAVMREIARIDATCPFWRDDVVEFERHRVAELTDLGRLAEQSRDAEIAARFIQEFQEERWFESPPESLRTQYVQQFRRLCEASTLPKLGQRLSSAWLGHDYKHLAKLCQQWHRYVEKLTSLDREWQPPEHILRMVDPGLQWFRRSSEVQAKELFDRDLKALHQALQTLDVCEDSLTRINFLLARAESHGQGIPEDTRTRVKTFRRSMQRSALLNVAVVVCLACATVAAVIAGFFMLRSVW